MIRITHAAKPYRRLTSKNFPHPNHPNILLLFLCTEALTRGAFDETLEPVAKIHLGAKFDDFDAGLVFCKLTYPIGRRQFARNPNPATKGRIWPQMDFCNWLIRLLFGCIDYRP